MLDIFAGYYTSIQNLKKNDVGLHSASYSHFELLQTNPMPMNKVMNQNVHI